MNQTIKLTNYQEGVALIQDYLGLDETVPMSEFLLITGSKKQMKFYQEHFAELQITTVLDMINGVLYHPESKFNPISRVTSLFILADLIQQQSELKDYPIDKLSKSVLNTRNRIILSGRSMTELSPILMTKAKSKKRQKFYQSIVNVLSKYQKILETRFLDDYAETYQRFSEVYAHFMIDRYKLIIDITDMNPLEVKWMMLNFNRNTSEGLILKFPISGRELNGVDQELIEDYLANFSSMDIVPRSSSSALFEENIVVYPSYSEMISGTVNEIFQLLDKGVLTQDIAIILPRINLETNFLFQRHFNDQIQIYFEEGSKNMVLDRFCAAIFTLLKISEGLSINKQEKSNLFQLLYGINPIKAYQKKIETSELCTLVSFLNEQPIPQKFELIDVYLANEKLNPMQLLKSELAHIHSIYNDLAILNSSELIQNFIKGFEQGLIQIERSNPSKEVLQIMPPMHYILNRHQFQYVFLLDLSATAWFSWGEYDFVDPFLFSSALDQQAYGAQLIRLIGSNSKTIRMQVSQETFFDSSYQKNSLKQQIHLRRKTDEIQPVTTTYS